MKKPKNILGLIPARGGSKGLKNKNRKVLYGKPLIEWTILNAQYSNYLSNIVVSTDSNEIAQISKRIGAEVPFIRPDYLSTDDARSIDVIYHALDYFKQKKITFEYIALLEPTSPLRKIHDIDMAIEKLMTTNNKNGIISVGKIHLEHPDIAKKKDGDILKSFYNKKNHAHRRQDLNEAYFPYGVLYLVNTKLLKKYDSIYIPEMLYYEIDRWQNYEIDDLIDFDIVELLLKKNIDKIIKRGK